MRNIVFILITCSLLVSAQVSEFPRYEFKSTSAYQPVTIERQYTVPVAAYELQNPVTYKPQRTVKSEYDDRPDFPAADPNWSPIGDMMYPLLIFSFIYFLVLFSLKKRS